MITCQRHQNDFRESNGFALVITLIMVAFAAIMVIVFLTSTSTDRATSTSYNYRAQAELAVQNGLEAAKRALTSDGSGNPITQNDTFIVTRVAPTPTPAATAEDTTAHYYYIGRATAGNTNITYYPLFSGGGNPQSVSVTAATTQPTYSAPASNVAYDVDGKTTLPALLPDPSPTPSPAPSPAWIPSNVTTQWVDVVDPVATGSPAPKMRYCFWIEDLGGYIDADAAGNISGASSSHTRDPNIMQPLIDASTAKPTSLIAMWTLFNSTATDPTATPQQAYNKNLVSNRNLLFTSETVKQGLPNPTASDLHKVARHIAAGTKSDSEQQIIPFGIIARTGSATYYPNAGQSKIDVNAKISAKDVNGIADAIKSNLLDWAASRRGGYPAGITGSAAEDSYRHTIAANVIAYAQPVGDAPIIGGDYRGTGAYPLVNEFYDYFNWTAVGAATITVEITSWVELWNMSNQTISGDVRYTDYYRHALDLGAFTYFDDKHDPNKPDPGETISGFPIPTQTVSMAPNEFRVLKFGPVTYTLSTGGTIPASPLTLHFRTSGKYTLEWKSPNASSFVVVDQSLGGVQMQTDTVYNPQLSSSKVPYKWNGCQPGFVYYGGVGNFYYNPGDPRLAYCNDAPEASNDYSSNATMWFRNQKPSSSNILAKQVKVSAWPDSGHDTALGTAGSKDTVSPPTTAPSGVNSEPTKAPSTISGAGKLKSITELANIYDPAQWNILPDASNHWSDIGSGTSANSHYGGGLTLRVGRPEFSRFDKNGTRASDLLNIFAVGTRRETQGLINLNTATRETLRSLGAGLLLNRDPDILPVSLKNALNPPTTSDQADKFADAVLAARNKQAFISTSQLAQLTDSTGSPFFGVSTQWSAPQVPPIEWNDPNTEEYFSRLFDLTSVRSRNFRVFVTGQYIDPRISSSNPAVLATVKKVYQVFLHPTRAAAGSIQSQIIDVTYEHEL